MNTPAIEYRKPTIEELGAVRKLRHEQLLGKMPVEQVLKPTVVDLEQTIHYAAFIDGNVISAVRAEPTKSDPQTFLISRMVTEDKYQSQGIGAVVLAGIEDIALHSKVRKLILDARPEAEVFYSNHGYKRDLNRRAIKSDDVAMSKELSSE